MFPFTVEVVRIPSALIVAFGEFSLHAGVTVVVVLSLHVAVAVYVALLLSFTDVGPEIDRPVSAAGLIVTANAFVAVVPPVTCTVKLYVPAAVGVPPRTPAVDRLSPAGREPADTDQLYGVVPPVAANVWLYAVPAVPEGSGLDVLIAIAAGFTVTANAFVAVAPPVT